MWTSKCKINFQKLKTCLTIALVLALPFGIHGYIVYYDASRVGLECVLMQHGKFICMLHVN